MQIDPRETLQEWIDRGGNMLSDVACEDAGRKGGYGTIGDIRKARIEDLFIASRIAIREICGFAARQEDNELRANT